MACNSCARTYSMLRKEKGCPGCGFSYCSKCLDNKTFIPKLNAEVKVCSKCNRSASISTETKTVVEPPDAYYKRLEKMYDQQATIKSPNTNIHTKDQLILERLKKLKEGRDDKPSKTTDDDIRNRLQDIKGAMPSTSNAEIEERLAKLRGVHTEMMTRKPVLPLPDTRTEQEQANELLKQYLEETNIDTKYKDEFDGIINDIESRMQKLKGDEPSTSEGKSKNLSPETVESEDEDEMVRKIVEKIKVESALEDNEIAPSTSDELPFCEICNEDARMRCMGCRYLFCKRCFEDHKDDDDGCNRYEPYQAPKSSNY